MLEVGVHHDHRRPARGAQAGAHRRLVAEIAGERYVADHRVGSGGGAQRLERAVVRAVVDADDLGAADGRHQPPQFRNDRRDVAGLVVGRQHDREFNGGGGHSVAAF